MTDFLQTIALLPDDGRLLATPVAVIAGLVYNFLPFMTLPLYASLDKVDHRLIEAAGDLYASPFTGFRKVTFPLSLPGVVSGTLLTFIPASGDYINAELLGTPKPVHGRQPDPVGVPHRAQLPAGREPVADPDGDRRADGRASTSGVPAPRTCCDRHRPPGRHDP